MTESQNHTRTGTSATIAARLESSKTANEELPRRTEIGHSPRGGDILDCWYWFRTCICQYWHHDWYYLVLFYQKTKNIWFSDSRPKAIGFWAWGRFCMFRMSIFSPICLPYWKCSTNSLWCSTKVVRTYLPVNMALDLFS